MQRVGVDCFLCMMGVGLGLGWRVEGLGFEVEGLGSRV